MRVNLKLWQSFVMGSMLHLSIKIQSGASQTLPFQFGDSNIDTQTSTLDDDSSIEFTLDNPMPFIGERKNTFYQNTNGVISFDEPYKSFRWTGDFPTKLLPDLVAAYWTDIDIRPGGADTNQLFARSTTQTKDIEKAEELIQKHEDGTEFSPKYTAVITYNRVNRFSMDTSVENSFQVAFAYNETDTWVILAYSQLEFFDADSSAVGALIGYNGEILPQGNLIQNISSNEGMRTFLNDTNCDQNGVYAYRLAKGKIPPVLWIDGFIAKIGVCADAFWAFVGVGG